MSARSELVAPSKPSGDGVAERRRRFHFASPASRSPGLRPTRGSGLGAVIDIEAGAAAADCADDPDEEAHAAAYTAAPSRAGSRARRAAGAPRNALVITLSDLRV